VKCPSTWTSRESTEFFLKLENEQRTGSFKIRGATNKMQQLTSAQRRRGVICSSAGNHAQGVALAARALGIKAQVVMPETTPVVKIEATRALGAEVVLKGDYYDEAYTHAMALASSRNLVFIHPYDDEAIMAGQGTIGLEIMDGLPDADTVIVPLGGGGLISGVATAIKAIRPETRVIGVVSHQSSGMMDLFQIQANGKRRPARETKRPSSSAESSAGTAPATIAEGIAIKRPSERVFNTYIRRLVDDIVAVDDDEIAQAIVYLLEKMKTVAEGAGAAAMAAAMFRRLDLGHKACVVVCGGNIDINVLGKVIERGQRLRSRLARLTVVVDDLPGNLNRLTGVIAGCRANILEVLHDRVDSRLGLRETRIDLLVETTSQGHIKDIENRLAESGFRLLP
jgi:threonine dehydratase